MKKMWKIFFIVVLLFVVFGIVPKTYADDSGSSQQLPEEEIVEMERPEDVEDIAIGCPDSGDPRLISICGSVRQAVASPIEFLDGSTAPMVSQVPVKGVSVYLYECDNSSPTCKQEGYLVHPFSSTSTNEEGRFHLVARKVDNSWNRTYEYCKSCVGEEGWKPEDYIEKIEVDMLAQSKRRYLVFKCNNNFQGIHVIPSYMDLTEVIHEVNCPTEYDDNGEEIPLEYMPPFKQFDFIGMNKLANHMGIDPKEYKVPQITGNNVDDGYSIAAQAYFENYKDEKTRSITANLRGADPRFTEAKEGSPKRKALDTALNTWIGNLFNIENFPDKGAWNHIDCAEIYKDTKWTALCASGFGKDAADAYEEDLYTNPLFTTQHLLPNIPPKYSLLYYRPLELRIDMTGYYQDHDDIAKYLGLQFSNCVGEVYKRKWNLEEDSDDEENKPEYPTCESLKACNMSISFGTENNSYMVSGPAQALATLNQFKEIEYENLDSVPVCITDDRDEKNPITIGEIQKPGEYCSDEKVLCDDGMYWNNYYLTNLGVNNKALKWGFIEEAKDDSVSSPETNPCNQVIFEGGKEGEGLPQSGCNSATAGSGDRSGNNSFGAMAQITGLNESSAMENLTDFIAQPFETDEDKKKDLMSGTQYLISSKPVAWGQYSEANENDQQLILDSEDDKDVYDNYFNNPDDECYSCNQNHYPGEDLKRSGSPPMGGKESGTRTQSSGIYMTSAAYNRVENLRGGFLGIDGFLKDRLDSSISISSGHGYIDWEMVKIKGKPTLEEAFSRIAAFLEKIISGVSKRKTFSDRTPNESIKTDIGAKDALLVTGFEVNECNFANLFPCGGVSRQIYPSGQWGDGGKCYPWHSVTECKVDMDSCDTYSRTCRVDICEQGYANVMFRCNPDGSYEILDKEIVQTDACSVGNWDTCVAGKSAGIKPLEEFNASDCIQKYGMGGVHNPGPIAFDYCTISQAGPYACDGDLETTTIINNTQQNIENENMDSINIDKVAEAGQKMYKAFRDPFKPDLTVQPAAWISLSSSITDTSKPSITKRKDVAGIGTGVGFLSRAQVGQPMQSTNYKELEPLYIHCQNDEIEGSSGTWSSGSGCNYEPIPTPEVLTIDDLKQALAETDESCNFKDSSECADAFMNGGEFSETFTTVMNLAGNKFKVSPAAILAYMKTVESNEYEKYRFFWSKEGEDYLKEATLPWYGAFNFCDDLEPVAQPPFDWILLWFSMGAVADSPRDENGVIIKQIPDVKDVYAEISPGRERTLSRCNFMDAVFVLAHTLSRNIYGDCPDQVWGDGLTKGTVANALNLHNWGADPKGAHKIKSEETPIGEEVWNACKPVDNQAP